MKALRGALHLNVLLALGASSIVAATALIGGQSPSLLAIAVAFMSVFAVYNFDRIADRTEGDGSTTPKRTAMLSRFALLVRVAIGGSAAAVGVIAIAVGGVAAAWICSFPLAGVLYGAPVFAGPPPQGHPVLQVHLRPRVLGLVRRHRRRRRRAGT